MIETIISAKLNINSGKLAEELTEEIMTAIMQDEDLEHLQPIEYQNIENWINTKIEDYFISSNGMELS